VSSSGVEPAGTRPRPVRIPRHRLPITLVVATVALALGVAGNLRGGDTPAAPTAASGTPLDLTRPFTGTPAATWPNGADGIVPPTARAVGGHGATQVGAALDMVKQALVAAHLDDRMLINHDPSAYLALLAPSARSREQAVLTGSGVAGDGGEATMIATGFTLLPIPVKVNGSMSVSTDGNDQLVVHTNYVFAYPFAPEDSGSITVPNQIVAIQHVRQDFTVVRSSRYATADQGLWPTSSQGYYESMACGPSERGYLAPAYSQPYMGPPQSDSPDSFYDPNHPIAITATCGGA
jgi:hypothetical protein